MTNENGFLGQQLFERDEDCIKTNTVYSEFCCPEWFWVLFSQKVPNES